MQSKNDTVYTIIYDASSSISIIIKHNLQQKHIILNHIKIMTNTSGNILSIKDIISWLSNFNYLHKLYYGKLQNNFTKIVYPIRIKALNHKIRAKSLLLNDQDAEYALSHQNIIFPIYISLRF